MNKSVTISLVVLITLFLSFNLFGQVAGDYQSNVATRGNWGDASSWQIYDGNTSQWINAPTAPTGNSGTITIQTGDTITLTAPITIASAYIKNIGILFTSATNIFTFGNGSTYEHGINGGTIPYAVWGDGSTCLITGAVATAPSLATTPVSFYNYTWNCTSQSGTISTNWDNVTVRGDLTCSATNGLSWRVSSGVTNGTRTITINGNLFINGGSRLTISGSSSVCQYNTTVNGNIVVSGSSNFQLCNGSAGFGTWYLNGNLTVSGTAAIVQSSNKTVGTILIFSKTNGTQSYNNTSTTANGQLCFGVMNNATVQMNAPLTIGTTGSSNVGNLVLTSGRFVTSATNYIKLDVYSNVVTGTGYVEGPLLATVNVNTSKTLTFPLGKSGVYRPVILNLTQDATTSTIYTAELKETPIPVNLLPVPATLDAVSTVRYVHIVKGAGANVSSATIQLNYNTNDGLDVSNKDMIRIAKDDGAGNWTNLGGSGTVNNTGSILSNSFGTSTSLGTLTTNDFILAHVNPASVVSLATLTTNAITSISTTFATSGGVISNDGNGAITAKGVCWNISGSPTTSDSHTSDGTTSAPFTSSITGLTAGQTYHVRAYATNSAGPAYGNEVVFTTLASLSTPTLVTNAVTNISNTTATGNGTISAWGGSPITDRGICWSTSHSPTLETAIDFNSSGAGGEGTFTAPIGGLSLGTTYYVRAYATNSTGTSYGNEVTEISFTTPNPQPDVYKIVKLGGTPGVDCNYTTITDAFNAVPSGYTGHWFIYVQEGTYYEKPLLAAGKINVVLIGQNRDRTILTYDDYAGKNTISNGTNTSYSVAIDAADFQAQNITFQNTANAYAPGSHATQAVALRTNGDRQSYYNCKMLGYQDTYYTWGGSGPDRIYNNNCYIEGSVDFIFGRDVALFDNCSIYCNRQGGTLTAASTEPGYSYGYVFLNSTIGSPASGVLGVDNQPMVTFYLGRPWQASPKTVFVTCYEPATVNAAGWTTMTATPSLYADYGCYGPGSVTTPRPVMNSAWPGANQPSFLTDPQAALYTIANIFSKNNKGNGFSYAANWTPSLITYDESRFDFPLPVELSTFTAQSNGRNVELKWSTSTEKNSASFEVQKKQANTETWNKIASVKAADLSNSPKYYSYTDKNAASGKYNYRLKMLDNDGTFNYSKVVSIDISAPNNFELSQNYPNPFNPSTMISYAIPFESNVKLIIYNSIGAKEKELVNSLQNGGYYELTFDAKSLSSGVYFYTIKAISKVGNQNFTSTKKMLLMK